MLVAIAVVCFALAALPTALLIWNLRLIRAPLPGHGLVPRRRDRPARLVSVLIPARNEADNIGAALDAVLASRGIEFEVIVLDDDSGDETARIVTDLAARDGRLRLLTGDTLPAGACGKTRACQHLAEAANGEVLVFLDADVRISPAALAALAGSLDPHEAPLVSGIPHQRTISLSEQLIVPLIDFILYGFLPVALMRRFRHPSFGAACGQLIAADRNAYRRVGGHAAVIDSVHDGVALARAFRKHGLHTDLIDASALAECRMYSSWPTVREGFVKNAHEGLGSPAGIVPWTLILGLGQVVPFVMLPIIAVDAAAGSLFVASASLALGGRAMLAHRTGHPAASVAGHPVGVALLIGIQWYALIRRWRRRPAIWKGRPVPLR